MDLKLRKLINNRLPGFTNGIVPSFLALAKAWRPTLQQNQPTNYTNIPTDSTVSTGTTVGGGKDTKAPTSEGAGPWFALGTWAGGGVAAGLNEIQNKDQIISNTNRRSTNVLGMSYLRYDDVDKNKFMGQYYTRAGASFFTNPFKGFTMLAGASAQRRKLEEAERRMLAENDYNRTTAIGDYFSQQEKLNDGVMHAQNGKDVHTAQGYSAIAPNARVEGQEVIRDPYTESSHIVPGPANGDNNYANLKPSDIVYTDKFGISKIAQLAVKAQQAALKDMKTRGPIGRATAQLAQALATKVLDELAQTQAQLRQVGLLGEEQYAAAKNGKDKLPGFKWGWANFASNVLPALGGLGQMIYSVLDKPKNPYSYRTNPYEHQALATQAGIRINPYSIYRDMLNQTKYAQYNLNNAGGLSGSQKALANIGLATGLMNTYGKLNLGIQEQNNKYLLSYADSLMKAGEADRTAMQNQYLKDLQYYSLAKASQRDMFNKGLASLIGANNQWYKNAVTRSQYNKTVGQYADDMYYD